jgi:hypothetical protein
MRYGRKLAADERLLKDLKRINVNAAQADSLTSDLKKREEQEHREMLKREQERLIKAHKASGTPAGTWQTK